MTIFNISGTPIFVSAGKIHQKTFQELWHLNPGHKCYLCGLSSTPDATHTKYSYCGSHSCLEFCLRSLGYDEWLGLFNSSHCFTHLIFSGSSVRLSSFLPTSKISPVPCRPKRLKRCTGAPTAACRWQHWSGIRLSSLDLQEKNLSLLKWPLSSGISAAILQWLLTEHNYVRKGMAWWFYDLPTSLVWVIFRWLVWVIFRWLTGVHFV